MANDAQTHERMSERSSDELASSDAESLVTALERSLRSEPKPSPEAEVEIRARLLGLYLRELRDPLSAAMHAEALLERETVDRAVLDAATVLVEHRPIAARIAEKLSAAYARLGEVASEIGMLSKELSLSRPPRVDRVKRRLADLHFEHLDDADGALDLLEPLVLRSTADDALRARYLQIAASSGGAPRALRALMRASRAEKDAAARARILCELGELHLKQRDVRRARQAFLDALEGAPGPEGLAAATRLLQLDPESADPKTLGPALEAVTRFEPDPSRRREAAEKLLIMPGTSAEPERAIVAWRALLDSPRRAEALDNLADLLERKNDVAGLVEVLRAKGLSREVLARLVPLLEKAGLWNDLAEALERQAELVTANEAATVLSRLGRVRMSRLSDGDGAITAFRRSLEIDPKNAMSRASLEKMMSEGGHRIHATELLERVYRAEGFADGIARVLSARAELSASPAEKLATLDQAFDAARAAALPRTRLLSLTQNGLGEAVRHAPRAVPAWLSRFRELTAASTDPARDAEGLLEALGGRAVDGPELSELACVAVDALLLSGKTDRARAFCAGALASFPGSTELLQRYDRIAGAGEPPRERLARYQAALERTADPGERRRIMQVLAAICREDDLPRAIDLWQRILRDDPKDLDALLGLFSAYERLENPDALFAEIEQALEVLEGEARLTVSLRKADALSKFGERERSADLRSEILRQPQLPSSAVESILTAAYEDDQPDVYRQALEIQADADDPALRRRALERLGDFHFERLGDRRAAIASWKPAARLYTNEAPHDEHARELYERVLDASPDDREAAWRLVELYAKAGEWARVPEVYGALLRSEGGLEAGMARLLELERDATQAGAVDEFISMVDETVPRLGTDERDSHYRLIQAKARILSADPARQAEASAAHRQVIESFGGEGDIAAFTSFIESRGSADDRQADLRWLFEFRASQAGNPLQVLSEWAKLEEEYDDVEGAIRVYDRILERAPRERGALEASARLKRAAGDFEGCLAALGALRDGAAPRDALDLGLQIGQILASELDRPLDAALAVAPCLVESRSLGQALDIVRRALSAPETRLQAIQLVEHATGHASPELAAEHLRALIAEAGRDTAVAESSRCSWYLRLIELRSEDVDAALELAKEGVRDIPNARPLWEALEGLARRADRPEEAAETYRRAMERGMAAELGEAIGRRIVEFLDEASSDSEEVLRTLDRVLERAPRARWALDRVKLVLSAGGRWEELFDLYDRAIENTPDEQERAELLDEAALAARDLARAPERAIAFLERLLELRPEDAPVQAALERLYERSGKAERLIQLLSVRLESATGLARVELAHRIASARLDLGDVAGAGEVVDGLLERGASMGEVKDLLEQIVSVFRDHEQGNGAAKGTVERAIARLSVHYAATGLTQELIRVTKTSLSLSREPSHRAQCVKDLVRMRLEAASVTEDAFSSTRASIEADIGDDPMLAEIAARALLEEATKEWQRRDPGPDSDRVRTAWATILELSELYFRAERPERAVAVLTDGAELPFPPARKRELRARIASSLVDRLNDPGRASAVFAELFEEDAGDAIAESCAEPFARLLQAAGRDRDQAELWARIGESRAASGRIAGAREAWARAARLWESLGDADRAIAAHAAGAAIGSEVAMESLGRLHAENGRWHAAAQALEWLFAAARGEARVRAGLSLADAHVNAGNKVLARNRLSELVRGEPGVWAARARLIDLHREDALWAPLAELLADSAQATPERERRLSLMREAASIRLRRLANAAGAVSLATAVLEMDPESIESRLELGEALDASGRHDESVKILRDGLSARGEKRSKHAGALHRAIARALFHAGRRAEALVELGAAAKLHPTEPTTLFELAGLATDEGELELAERTLRALLLTLHPAAEQRAEGPTRAEVYLDLSRILELRGDIVQARDLVESAFDSSLQSEEQGARLERALEQRGRHDLLALAIERRLSSAKDPEAVAKALDALVTLWEGPLERREDTRSIIARHAELAGREAEQALNLSPVVWAAHERACAAAGGEGSRGDAVKRHVATLARAAEHENGHGAAKLWLEAASLYADRLGEVERAATLVEPLFERDPSDADAWARLRSFHERLGNRDRLVQLARAALSAADVAKVGRRLRLDLAELLLAEPADVEGAIVILKELLADDPRDAAVRERLADVLERAGRLEELATVLSAALGLLDRAGQRLVSMRLGRALEGASRRSEAAAIYTRIAEDDQASVEDLRAIAGRLEALASDGLSACLERLIALETGPEAARLARRLVELRSAKGDRTGTVRALVAGFDARPEDPFFRERLVKAYEEGKRWDQVAAVFQRAAAQEPSNRALLQRLVEAHQRNQDPDSALEVLNGALRRSPSDADLLRLRAWIHEAAGRIDEALGDLEKAHAADPSLSDDLMAVLAQAAARDDGSRSLELVELLLQQDRALEARSTLEALLERRPEHVGALERLASLSAAEGDWVSARTACQQLLPLLAGDPAAVARVSLVLADACERRGGLEDATDALERALELVPGSVEISSRLGRAYEASGNWSRLAHLLESEAARAATAEERGSLLLRAAELLLRSDQSPEHALELAEKGHALDPHHPDGLLVSAQALARLGRNREAESTLRELLRLAKARAGLGLMSRAHLELARLHLSRDEIFEAFDGLNQSFNADPKNDEAGFLLGLVALDLDDERTATRALRAATAPRSTLTPTSKAVALYELARVARGKGDLRRAKQLATSAVAENADDARARALLEAL